MGKRKERKKVEGIKAIGIILKQYKICVVLAQVESPLGMTRAMVTTFNWSFLLALVTAINILSRLSTADPCII